VETQREPTGWLGPLLCGGFAGTIVTCLWLLWIFLTAKDTPAGQGAFVPSARGMVIMSSPPLMVRFDGTTVRLTNMFLEEDADPSGLTPAALRGARPVTRPRPSNSGATDDELT